MYVHKACMWEKALPISIHDSLRVHRVLLQSHSSRSVERQFFMTPTWVTSLTRENLLGLLLHRFTDHILDPSFRPIFLFPIFHKFYLPVLILLSSYFIAWLRAFRVHVTRWQFSVRNAPELSRRLPMENASTTLRFNIRMRKLFSRNYLLSNSFTVLFTFIVIFNFHYFFPPGSPWKFVPRK